MKNIIVNYESLIAGALLYFGKIDKYDINLLIEEIKKCPDVEFYMNKLSNIDFFIKKDEFGISIKDEYDIDKTLMGIKKTYTIREKLESCRKDYIENFFNNFDIENFVLKKISKINIDERLGIIKTFSEKQQQAINNLIKKGFIVKSKKDNNLYVNVEENQKEKNLIISTFIKDNKSKFNKFIYSLAYKKYDMTYLNEYLLSFNIFNDNIFDIKEYKKFIDEKRNIKYIDEETVKIDNNISYEESDINKIDNLVKCEIGNTRLKRPNTICCGCTFEIDEDKVFTLKNGGYNSFYTLCPNCGFIVKLKSQNISRKTVTNLILNSIDERQLYIKKCKESKRINEEYYAKNIRTKYIK